MSIGQDKSNRRAVELDNLCSIVGVRRIDRMRNEGVRMI